MCAFCYNQIKLHCRSLCPGCRREYGSAEGEVVSRTGSGSEGGSAPARSAQPTTSTSSTHTTIPVPRSALQAASQATSAATSAARGPLRPVTTHKRAAADGGVAGGHKAHREDAAAALPSGATWAVNARQHQQQEAERQQSAPALVGPDDTAWPSLAAPQPQPQQAAAPAPAPSTRQNHARHDSGHRHSTSSSSSTGGEVVVDRTQSMGVSSSLESSGLDTMSQDPVVLPEQLGLASHTPGGSTSAMGAMLHGAGTAFLQQQQQSVQLSTSVYGVRRNVNVQLSGAEGAVQPYPEASSMLSSIHHAMGAGTMSTKEGAAQLVALLKHKEAQNGGRPLMAAAKPPPGFSAPVAPPPGFGAPSSTVQPPPGFGGPSGSGLGQPGSTLLNPLDSPVVPAPPIGRYQPIGKPIGSSSSSDMQQAAQQQQHQQQQLGGMFGNGAYRPQQQQQQGTYSMWSGLPGIDLTGGYNPLGALWGQSAYGAAPGGGLAGVQQPMLGSYQPTVKAPPPGFGGPPGMSAGGLGEGPKAAAPQQAGFAPGEGRYNPLLGASNTRAPPPGYRPQLGAGL